MMYRRRRRNGLTRLPEISLTPLIDTVLVLLVIFMVATPMLHNSLAIDLPEGNMKEGSSPTESSLVVAVTPPEKLTLNDRSYAREALLEELAQRVKTQKDKRVYIQCDRKVSSGTLVKIIDSIKYVAGVEHVILSTERVR
jgi:biopolymer transport protein TolR